MISVFTPTYNRKELLKRLYSSLLQQTDKNFEWIIVDDGSSDNTKEQVENWISEKEIDIKYRCQKNSGKHVAFNNGVNLASGDLYFCVDSDDFLPNDAIEIISNASMDENFKSAIGIIGLKIDTKGKQLSDDLPKNIVLSKTYELSNKYSCKGEKTIIYKTEVLKTHSFPVIENEKFIGECVLYDKLDDLGPMYLLDKVLTICEYQEAGLSNLFLKIMLNNPIGFKVYHKQRIDMVSSLKERIGHATRYNAFKFMSSDTKYNYHGKHRVLAFLTIGLGFLLKLYYLSKKSN